MATKKAATKTTKATATRKTTAKKTATKKNEKNNVDKIVHIAKTVNGEITATAGRVNDSIFDTAQAVNSEIVKTAKTVNTQVWGVTKEVTEDVVKTTRVWTNERMEDTKKWANEQVDKVQDRLNIKLEMPKFEMPNVDVRKAVKETNELAFETTESIIEGATKNGEKWQKLTRKAINGGLELAGKQQGILFDTLEAVKAQIVEGRDRTKKLFSNN
ncbi:MAG: hypothetical protein AB8G22_28460 [Saprospiraceae bacterium]